MSKSIVPVTFRYVDQNGQEQLGTFNQSMLNGQYEGGQVKLVVQEQTIVGVLPCADL